MEALNQYKNDLEDKRDNLNGLKLLRIKCNKQLSACYANGDVLNGHSEIADYFAIKADRLTRKISELENELLTIDFATWLIKRAILNTVNAKAKEVNYEK